MAAKSVRSAKDTGDSLEMRLCRFEEATRELEARMGSFNRKRAMHSVRTR